MSPAGASPRERNGILPRSPAVQRDLHLLRAVVEVILRDGEEMSQGISIAAIQAPVLVEIEPAGGVLLTIGNEGLADEVRAVADAFSAD